MNEADCWVYVSCEGDHQIHQFSMDRLTGALTRRGSTQLPAAAKERADDGSRYGGLATSGAPLASSPNGTTLYASMRMEPTRLLSYRVDREVGLLDLLAEVPIPASTPFIHTDRSGRFLFGAAYHGHLVWVARIEEDGSVGAPPVCIVEQVITPHSVLMHPNNRFAYVAATGHEEILAFEFDQESGKLTRTGAPGDKVIAGATPRHMAFHPNSEFLYCMNETSGTIDSFCVDQANGELTHLQCVDPRPPECRSTYGIGADLHVTPDGRFLYGSSRASNTVSCYAINAASGMMNYVETVPTGKVPRSFAVEPTGRYLIAAGQGSAELGVYDINPASGRMTKLASYEAASRPTWVEIVERTPT
ncbi:MAG: beta-propeller fold lactonase family protein [Novosphingobium sp.]|nr:beta-propeller fold lactonase family protein [Novosphingobium sp.]